MNSEVSVSLALALGSPIQFAEFSWAAVFDTARQERLAPLAWLRSGARIRADAPPDVVASWRDGAMSAISLAEFWSALTGETVRALRTAGIDAVVLKGLPLAQRLYADIAARPCSDLDLHVPLPQRQAAHEALLAAGWRWRIGAAPREGGYLINRNGRSAILEVHSSLLDDSLVSHLPFLTALGTRSVEMHGSLVASHDDDQLPAFLATHLAKHAMAPLLWFVDFAELWKSLTVAEQNRAREAARSARAHRYLAWAVCRTEDIVAAADGDGHALRRLGFNDAGRTDAHNAVRVVRLAATPMDALRVISAWALPREIRRDWRTAAEHVGSRLRKPLSRALGTRRAYGARAMLSDVRGLASRRALVVDAGDFGALIRDIGQLDARFTIRVRGSSMRPSIQSGTLVCLTPRNGRPVAVGTVVLAMTPRGGYMMHRVIRTGNGWVQTRGDGNGVADLACPLDSVVAIAESILVNGVEQPIRNPRPAIARRLAWKVAQYGIGRRRYVHANAGDASDSEASVVR